MTVNVRMRERERERERECLCLESESGKMIGKNVFIFDDLEVFGPLNG